MFSEEDLRRRINSRRILSKLEQQSGVRCDERGRRILTPQPKSEEYRIVRPSVKKYRGY